MNEQTYEKYLSYLQNLEQHFNYLTCPGSLVGDLYSYDNSPCAIALKMLADLVVGIVYPYNESKIDDSNVIFEQCIMETDSRMTDEQHKQLNAHAIRFVVRLYMDYFDMPPTHISVSDLSENMVNGFDYSKQNIGTSKGKAKLREYQGLLRDLTKRNRLMHFRNSKDSLTFCYPSLSGISEHLHKDGLSFLNENATFLKKIFCCQACGQYVFKGYDEKLKDTEKCPNCHEEGSLKALPEKTVVIENQEKMVKCPDQKCGEEEIVRMDWLKDGKAHNIVCSKCGKPMLRSYPLIFTSHLKETKKLKNNSVICQTTNTFAVLKKLENQARNKRRNFGLHSLYLAVGFLKWEEKNQDKKEEDYRSPILLCRVLLSLNEKTRCWELTLDGDAKDAIMVNATLAYRLKHYDETRRIEVPKYDDDYDTLSSYLFKFKAFLLKEELTWEVEEVATLASFNSQKASLEEEIEALEEEYLRHPFINRLCGGELVIQDAKTSRNVVYPVGEYSICDADASQESIIKAAVGGESFVLEGPPGTGKSQTITNIISEFIAREKTVLFVTQKATARSIICDNMRARDINGISLMDYCLNFDEIAGNGSSAIATSTFLENLEEKSAKNIPLALNSIGKIELLENEISAVKEQLSLDIAPLINVNGGTTNILSYIMRWMDVEQEQVVSFDQSVIRKIEGKDLEKLEIGIEAFYENLPSGYLDYKTYPLYGLWEMDYSGGSFPLIKDVLNCFVELSDICTEINSFSLNVFKPQTIQQIKGLATAMDQVAGLPKYYSVKVDGDLQENLEEAISYCEDLTQKVALLKKKRSTVYYYGFDKNEVVRFNVGAHRAILENYSFPLFRLKKEYRSCIDEIKQCYKTVPMKLTYEEARETLSKIAETQQYFQKLQPLTEVESNFDFSQNEWKELRKKYTQSGDVSFELKVDLWLDFDWLSFRDYLKEYYDFSKSQYKQYFNDVLFDWLASNDDYLKNVFAKSSVLLLEIASKLESLFAVLKPKLDKNICDVKTFDFQKIQEIFEQYYDNRNQLHEWIPFVGYYETAKNDKVLMQLLDTCIAEKINSARIANGALLKSWWTEVLNQRLSQSDLSKLNFFRRENFENHLKEYAELDRRRIKEAVQRAYIVLQDRKSLARQAEGIGVGRRTRTFTNERRHRVRDIIKNKWDIIAKINPCFMMSPLNVGQYIDPSIKFDLVIFDEASQIFTEDALASIYRGKQIIVVGDKKQLPPSGFFRTKIVSDEKEEKNDDNNDAVQDEEVMGSMDSVCSLLYCTGQIFTDSDHSLCWHYRSCDESLISFSNEHFYGGKLITFPAAAKQPRDGVTKVFVEYNPDGCYESGQHGKRTNRNEAAEVIECLKAEIKNNKDYSVGIVAFNMEQASLIEEEWQRACGALPKNPQTDEELSLAELREWEKLHAKEGLIVCNLDSIQGDERDTIIISTCYGKDQNGNFNLLTLGPIRGSGGLNRLNVAITRARHKMVVVSSLNSILLRHAIENSKGDSKKGASEFADFLKYVEDFTSPELTKGDEKELTGLEKRICTILQENNIRYKRNLGASDSKIDIAILDEDGVKYKAGLIFDYSMDKAGSIREYARLRDEVLKKYGWNIYHIWTMAWFRAFETEQERLLNYIQSC